MEPITGAQTHIDVTSYHEAGHALAAMHEGRQVFGIGVSLNFPGNGLYKYAVKPGNPFDLMNSPGSAQAAWEHTLATTCADIRILLAGPLAEAIALGKPLRSLGARSDLEKCMHRAVRLCQLGEFVSGFTKIEQIDV